MKVNPKCRFHGRYYLGTLVILISLDFGFANVPSSNSLEGDNVVPKFNSQKSSKIGNDQVITKIDELPKVTDSEKNQMIEEAKLALNKVLGNQPPPLKEACPNTCENEKTPQRVVKRKPKRAIVQTVKRKVAARKRPVKQSGISIYEPQNVLDESPYPYITLPSASLTPGTVMAGVEVSTESRMVDLKIDYAFLGPNNTIVDLKGCHTWIKVNGNYNTERIYGTAEKISCRTTQGRVFSIKINGQIRDFHDEYIGMKAKLITRGKVAAAALEFLQNGTAQFGEAMAAAQVRTNVVDSGLGTNSAQNVDGNQGQYIAGKTLSGASAGFMKWWIDYYKSLSPTLAIKPGTKIYLSMIDQVQIPREFFHQKRINTYEKFGELNEPKYFENK